MALSKFTNTIPLSETTKFIVDNRGKTAPTASTGIALIATNCVTNEHLYPLYERLRYVSQETYDTWFRSHPQAGDILLTNKGSQNGAICLVPDPVDFVIAQDMVALRANENVIDALYLFAALRSPYVQSQIKNLDVSGVIPHFKKTDFDKLHLPYPDRKTQEFIGRFYFDLSYKIEVNRRMNRTLNAIATSMFNDWFVDFGPTRTKADGTAQYLRSDLWVLFPDDLDNEGKPKEWRKEVLGSEFKLTMGQSPPGNTYNTEGDGLPFFQGRTDFGFRYPRRRMFCTAPTRTAEADDTLVSVRAPVGDLNMAWEKCCIGRGIAAVRHKSGSRSFTYYAMVAVQEQLRAYEQTGTVFGAINKQQFQALETTAPSPEIIDAYEHTTAPFDSRIRTNTAEIDVLTELRDRLLPKLMSGEMRLKDAEQKVGDAL